jgi:hypothetical protein
MLLLNLILLIDVTFSTPTPVYSSLANANPKAITKNSRIRGFVPEAAMSRNPY